MLWAEIDATYANEADRAVSGLRRWAAAQNAGPHETE
jgi:hypothetical protein